MMRMISVLIPTLHETKWMKKNLKILSNDDRITEILIEKSKPRGYAREKLLMRANNELLLWLDSDIELVDNPIDIFLSHLKKGVAGVCATPIIETKNLKSTLLYTNREAIRRILPKVYDCSESQFNCSLFKKSVLMEVNGFNSKLHFAEDSDVYMKLKNKGYKIIGLRDYVVIHHHEWANIKDIKNYITGYYKIRQKYSNYFLLNDLYNCSVLKKIQLILKILRELDKIHYFPIYIIYFFYIDFIKRLVLFLSRL
jgi:cellulose synthase/poly-beta-1,6-N-acetylglucosamine synthase-like glycosyltransferase